MSEQSHGKMRPSLPRSSDLGTVTDPVVSPTEGRDSSGRFASANPWAGAAKWRALIADGLGRELEGEAGEIGRRAYRLFRAFLADMPVDCANVRSLVQQRARAAALADAYATQGMKLGPMTPEGAAALDEALKWSKHAERVAVTALDIATRFAVVARSKPLDAHAEVVATFGRKTKP